MNNSPSPQRLATRPDSPRFQGAEMGPAGLQTSPDQTCSGPGTPVITGRGHAALAHGRAPSSLPAGATPIRPSGELAALGAHREWVLVSLQGRTSPQLTSPATCGGRHASRLLPGSPGPLDSGLPFVLHGALGSTRWAPARTAVLGALGGGACRTPDYLQSKWWVTRGPQGDHGQLAK